jgi:putative ATP-binding cassette transporter
VVQELPDAAVISIAHREVVAKYHQLHWQFVHENGLENQIDVALVPPRYTIQRSSFVKPAKEPAIDRLPL